MPTYTYQCKKCEHTMQVFHSMSASPRVKCDACGSRSVVRIVGTGAGVIFKGSGFYETDYKKKDGKTTGAPPKSDTKTETSSTKSESKSPSGPDSGSKAKGNSSEAA